MPVPDKSTLRQLARERRAALSDIDRTRFSNMIGDRLLQLPEVAQATSVLLYVGVRTEVQTLDVLSTLLSTDKRVLVPYCRERTLELFRLQDLSELQPGRFGIPEPQAALRSVADRRCDPQSVDTLIVPGLAFDLQGHRLGYGAGYFDRLLQHMRPSATVVGLAYECQIFPSVPVDPHDVPVHYLLTERNQHRTAV